MHRALIKLLHFPCTLDVGGPMEISLSRPCTLEERQETRLDPGHNSVLGRHAYSVRGRVPGAHRGLLVQLI